VYLLTVPEEETVTPKRSLAYTDITGRRRRLTFTQYVYLDAVVLRDWLPQGWGGLSSTRTLRILAERGLLALSDDAPHYRFRATALGDEVHRAWNDSGDPAG
jgi:hypothetical protein